MSSGLINKLQEQVTNRERCCDCISDIKPLLGCTRSGKSLVQCVNCFETFRSWSLDEISIDEVRKVYNERREENLQKLGVEVERVH